MIFFCISEVPDRIVKEIVSIQSIANLPLMGAQVSFGFSRPGRLALLIKLINYIVND